MAITATGYDVLLSTSQIDGIFPTVPWSIQGLQLAAVQFINVDRVIQMNGWDVSQIIDPSSATSYTFTNGDSSITTYSNSLPSEYSQGINLQTNIGVNYAWSLVGSGSTTGTFGQANSSQYYIVNTTHNFSDTKGTDEVADDVSSYMELSYTGNTNFDAQGVQTGQQSSTFSQRYSANGIIADYRGFIDSTFIYDPSTSSTSSLATLSFSHYQFSDVASSFQLSFGGSFAFQGDAATVSLSVNLSDFSYSSLDFAVTAPVVAPIYFPLDTTAQNGFGPLNIGWWNFDDLTAVKASTDQYLLPEAIKGDNVFHINNANGASVAVGGGNDQVYGGAGLDTAVFDFARSDITSISASSDGLTIMLKTLSEQKLLSSIEELAFTDQTVSLSNLLQSSQSTNPLFSSSNSSTGYVEPTRYSGPVSFLEWEVLGGNTGDVVIGASTNDFMNLLGGDDAANGAAGRDVLDGGIGSSFLTGGTEADTFFVDGRNATSTWSTITDFSRSEGDTVNMWGWRQGVSRLVTSSNDGGAAGYTGATFHYDLDGNGAIDTSITFAGLTTSQVGNPTVNSVAGNSYLLWA